MGSDSAIVETRSGDSSMPERRNGHNYKSYVTALGEIVLLTERDQVKRVAEAHDAADARRHMEDVGHAGGAWTTRPGQWSPSRPRVSTVTREQVDSDSAHGGASFVFSRASRAFAAATRSEVTRCIGAKGWCRENGLPGPALGAYRATTPARSSGQTELALKADCPTVTAFQVCLRQGQGSGRPRARPEPAVGYPSAAASRAAMSTFFIARNALVTLAVFS